MAYNNTTYGAGPSTSPSSLLNATGNEASVPPTYQQVQYINPAQMLMGQAPHMLYQPPYAMHYGIPPQQHQPVPVPIQPPMVQQAPVPAPIPVPQPISAPPIPPLAVPGDWSKDIAQLAKTAELKKQTLTLQLHTSNIVAEHVVLDHKAKAIQQLREHKQKLESEKQRILECLREISADKEKAGAAESALTDECASVRQRITALTEGDYKSTRTDVDRLRAELGKEPAPSLTEAIQEGIASDARLTAKRESMVATASATGGSISTRRSESVFEVGQKRDREDGTPGTGAADSPPVKRPRGRPKGSKNKTTKESW